MRLSMVGTGYVGLVTGVCLANTGNDVVCLDIDKAKLDLLRKGKSPIYEPGLDELLERNIKAGRLRFSSNPAEAHAAADMIFICVGTPSDDRGRTDMSAIWSAVDAAADALKAAPASHRRRPVVVMKSTVPVGTTLEMKQRLAARAGPAVEFDVANNPEFLKEGAAIEDFNRPDRVVVGVENERVADRMRDLYDPFVRNGHPIHTMDILSSEMVKYASNAMLACKISFINEMAALCEAYGANIARVREGMCADKRIGNQFLYPGLGYGGSCFPKDTLACVMMGEQAGVPTPLNKSVHDVNQATRERFFNKIQAHFKGDGGLVGKTLGFWGLAFKPRTDDIREAPALTLIRKAVGFGARVLAYDPVANDNARRELGPSVEIVDDMYAVAQGADALVVCTDWDEFKSPDWERLSTLLKGRTIFDGRNLYLRVPLAERGFTHYAVGRAVVRPK